MAAHFGAMLLNRRRQLGLSIQQVANTVKIRPQIIEFFETEDFAAMPPRGYAQGMISSYARYLGLNPRVVVEAYLQDLHEFENAAPGLEAGRFQDAAAEASPRSSNAQGRYYMVDSVPASRYGQRPPQAGYVSESTSTHEPVSARRLRSASIVNSRDPQAQGRPAESAARYQGTPGGSGERRQGSARGGTAPSGRDGYGYGSDAQVGRDGRYQQQAGRAQRTAEQRGAGARGQSRGYGSAGAGTSSGTGRQARGGTGYGSGSGSGRGGRGGGGGGAAGGGFLSGIDPRFLVVGTALIVLLIVFAVFTITKGCTSAEADAAGSSGSATAVTVVSTATSEDDAASESSETEDSDEAEADDAADDGSDATAEADEETEAETETEETAVATETIVTVEVADDAVAYLEVKLDGVSVLGSDQVGPVTLEYTVEEQIVITTDSPSDVKVYVNGEKVSYDIKTSGVAKVTISADGTSSTASDSEDETDSE